MNPLQISVDYLRTANYALFHNHIPVCHAIELTNVSERPVDEIIVSCSGEFISRYDSETIAGIDPGETVRISAFSIAPEASKLASITERVVTEFTLTVTRHGDVICEEKYGIELMPYDHWTGIRTLPQTIASFITPNNPAINSIVLKSAEVLKQLTGSSSLNEYQTGDSNDVRQQVAAVFAAIHGLGIVYRGVPASYEAVGQRVTMPDQVVATKIANCIELTLLMATVLEAIGINCVIIFQKGHAFLGVWLVNDCYPCSVCDDPAY
ncbi:MAG: transglutaminase-like domain-containing protein, partial [Paramuribaculum sp.]|nr:transglutaminase-like domain-containing protein [Paramuribaculum sp.]